MTSKTYAWKRFWSSRDAIINLGDDGFLSDPESLWGAAGSPTVVAYEQIDEKPCLVLLGEPGLGKSTTLKEEFSRARDSSSVGKACAWIDLSTVDTSDGFMREVFDNCAVRAWRDSNETLTLFLDALDETFARVKVVSKLLLKGLEAESDRRGRFRLRITCRTAEWRKTLEDGLEAFWGSDHVGIYELAPLRRKDVFAAAGSEGLDPSDFLRAVIDADAVALAISPVTLRFLIGSRKRNEHFGSSRSDLYLRGCQEHCTESLERLDSGLTPLLSPEQRLVVAARIAALMLLTGHHTLCRDPDVPNALHMSDLVGGTETVRGSPFSVGGAEIQDTLDTGLFSSRGAGRMGWSHLTYAECLAADYLLQRRVPTSEILKLLQHPGDADRRLTPQLRTLAGWLADRSVEVFDGVLATDPEALLRSDLASADPARKARLIDTFLARADEGKIEHLGWEMLSIYRHLDYPDISGQLRSILEPGARSTLVREIAVDIAGACKSRPLAGLLAGIALDSGEPDDLRDGAAQALVTIGDSDASERLKEVLRPGYPGDPKDQLRGAALRANWPVRLTVPELLAALTPRKQASFLGSYWLFFHQNPVIEVPESDLTAGLLWVEALGRTRYGSEALEEIAAGILLRAWRTLDLPGVLSPFARIARHRLRDRNHIISGDLTRVFNAELTSREADRRRLLDAIIDLSEDGDRDGIALLVSPHALVTPADFPRLLARLDEGLREPVADCVASLISRLITPSDSAQMAQVREAMDRHEGLRTRAEWALAPAPARTEVGPQPIQATPQPPPPLSAELEIKKLLEKAEGGDLNAWWHLTVRLMPQGEQLKLDLRSAEGWASAGPETRARMLSVSRRYLDIASPEPETWINLGLFNYPAAAGVRALTLLRSEAPAVFDAIPPDTWRRWAPAIVGVEFWPASSEQGILVGRAFRHAPEKIVGTISTLLAKQSKEPVIMDALGFCGIAWSPPVARLLLGLLRSPETTPEAFRELLRFLRARSEPESQAFIRERLAGPIPPEGPERQRLVDVAAAVLSTLAPGDWDRLWPVISGDVAIGTEIVARSCGYDPNRRRAVADGIPDAAAGQLFIWLVRACPFRNRENDDDPSSPAWPSDRVDPAEEFRDTLLASLRERGTPEACTALRNASEALPEAPLLSWHVLMAQKRLRERTWVPMSPAEILALVSEKDSRIVRDEVHLLDLVVESLGRLERELHGELPAVRDLWDKGAKGAFRPRDEEDFSDYVTRFLKRDLQERRVVINREVQIRRRQGASPGERTDIRVDAFALAGAKDRGEPITVILEAKGSWHDELETAMESQLVCRYLKENACQTGLYLVGWFNCAQWAASDPRQHTAMRRVRADIEAKLASQARGLSRDGLTVRSLVLPTGFRGVEGT